MRKYNKLTLPEYRLVLRQAVDWLNTNRTTIRKRIILGGYQNGFDYPDYFGMPKKVADRLTSEEVDWIQEALEGRGFWPE